MLGQLFQCIFSIWKIINDLLRACVPTHTGKWEVAQIRLVVWTSWLQIHIFLLSAGSPFISDEMGLWSC